MSDQERPEDEVSNRAVREIAGRDYEWGFVTDIEADTLPPGLDEDIVRGISARKEEPEIMNDAMKLMVVQMLEEAIDCEMTFAEDILGLGVAGLSPTDMREYLKFIADQRLEMLGIPKRYGARNPFPFMELQDVQGLSRSDDQGHRCLHSVGGRRRLPVMAVPDDADGLAQECQARILYPGLHHTPVASAPHMSL